MMNPKLQNSTFLNQGQNTICRYFTSNIFKKILLVLFIGFYFQSCFLSAGMSSAGSASEAAAKDKSQSSIMNLLILGNLKLGSSGGSWSKTSSMSNYKTGHQAILLSNGKVLVLYSNTAEIFDPSAGNWTIAGAMIQIQSIFTATLLTNGNVLVIGVYYPTSTTTLPCAELYVPSTGVWSKTGTPSSIKFASTLLSNGKVLATSDTSTEIYDPSIGTWSSSGNMIVKRYGYTSTLLNNGKVLITGGTTNFTGGSYSLSTAELFNPSTGTWASTGSMLKGRTGHKASLLPDGRVLVTGGEDYFYNYTSSTNNFSSSLAGTELYDPAKESWNATGNMSNARMYHTITLLSNGNILVSGGTYFTKSSLSSSYKTDYSLASAELYNPSIGTWSFTGTMTNDRFGHTATKLSNGNVLVTGGTYYLESNLPDKPYSYLSTAEIYSP